MRVADVALNRMLKAEVSRLEGKHAAQTLLDLSAFYDRAGLRKLPETARELGYPMPLLVMGLQAYVGPRYLQGENVVSVKINPVAEFTRAFPDAQTEVWIDDIGYTIVGTDPQWVAHRTMQAYRHIAETIASEGQRRVASSPRIRRWKNGSTSSAETTSQQGHERLGHRCYSWQMQTNTHSEKAPEERKGKIHQAVEIEGWQQGL